MGAFASQAVDSASALNLKVGPAHQFVDVYQSEVDRGRLVFSTNDGRAWATTDCGRRVHLVAQGARLINLKHHPGNASLVLALVRRGCSGEFECVVHNKLLLSEDGGATFRSVRSFVFHFDWVKHADYSRSYGSHGIVVTEQDNSTRR